MRIRRGRRILEMDNTHFSEAIEDLIIMGIGIGNYLFTWNIKRGGDQHVVSCLNQFLVSVLIMELGSDIPSLVLPFVGSDH